jgi:hypothetical protein
MEASERLAEEIERLAEEFLALVPAYVWDGMSLPVPVEDIADSHAGLLIRDVEDLSLAPGRERTALHRRPVRTVSITQLKRWRTAAAMRTIVIVAHGE